jgi:eukaryotic-like serine/threonine-protein kinase
VISFGESESALLGDGQAQQHVGRLLAGRYAILRKIGAGGMARVYRGRHVTLGRPVAIKILREPHARRAACVGRFLREARATARIRHPNVVEVLDFGQESDGTVYCVMELVSGEPLSATLAREGSLSWQRTKHVMLQVCDALEAAHAAGVIHRDVKPDNCLRLASGAAPPGTDAGADGIKLIDFGIAKMTGTQPALGGPTIIGTVMGTADYMAPEQARGTHTDHRTDVYGAGVLMYELLTGQVPFSGTSNVDLLAQHLYVLPEPPSKVAPMARIPPSVDETVLRALSKDPEGRFQSIAQMRSAIAELELEPPRPVVARVPCPNRWPRRRSWQLRLGLGLAAGGAALLVGAIALPSGAELDGWSRQEPRGEARFRPAPIVPAPIDVVAAGSEREVEASAVSEAAVSEAAVSEAAVSEAAVSEAAVSETEPEPPNPISVESSDEPPNRSLMVRRASPPPPAVGASSTGTERKRARTVRRRAKKRR